MLTPVVGMAGGMTAVILQSLSVIQVFVPVGAVPERVTQASFKQVRYVPG